MKNNEEKFTSKPDSEYSYYSRVLKEPFDSVEDLKEAEEAYYAIRLLLGKHRLLLRKLMLMK